VLFQGGTKAIPPEYRCYRAMIPSYLNRRGGDDRDTEA